MFGFFKERQKKKLLEKLESMTPEAIYQEAERLAKAKRYEEAFPYYDYIADVLNYGHMESQYELSDYIITDWVGAR